MPIYEVEEIVHYRWRIEAESPDKALEQLDDGIISYADGECETILTGAPREIKAEEEDDPRAGVAIHFRPDNNQGGELEVAPV